MTGLGLNGSLYMGRDSLSAQRQAIETIGNNISNVNTPGYARQRVSLVTSYTVNDNGNGERGSGVTVQNIENLRSTMLDNLVQQSLGNQGYADNQATLTSTVQDSLGEQLAPAGSSSTSSTTASGSGQIQDAMLNFFSSLQSLASTPSNATSREVVVQDAQTLSTSLNGAYTRLQQTQSQIAADAGTQTTQINQLAQSIANLNHQIVLTQAASGSTANDLINSRAADIEQLSSMVNITATAQSDGTVTVALADNSAVVLVNKGNSGGAGGTQTLSTSFNANAAVPLTVSASTSGPLGTGIPSSGSLGAALNVVNNIIGSPAASGNTGLLGSLDGVANALITQVNAQNQAGYDANGNAGGTFFTGTGAANIAVKTTVASNPNLIAASNGTGVLDGSNALAMSQLQSQPAIVPAFQTMVSNLGQTVNAAQTSQTTQDQITKQLQTQRNSVSGVSIDEEMTNLINFQQAYDASARFITTISSLYDTLVNKTT